MKSAKSIKRLALGLDLSTQSLSAVLLDIDSASRVFEYSLDYNKDPRLNIYGIQKKDYIAPPRIVGEADQPPSMFFAAIDALFEDMRKAGVKLGDIVVINDSGQQHGHVYLNHQAQAIFAGLQKDASARRDLVSNLEGCLSYGLAPIWMTSNTLEQTEFMRDYVGGKKRMIELSGSNAPLRFTGSVIRRVAQQFPEVYQDTEVVQLISSLVPAVLTGNVHVPLDFGNGAGMSLMDYTRKKWSTLLISAASAGLKGGAAGLKKKLPPVVAPDAIVGVIATYFIKKYGFSPSCQIAVGSGDNPQSKVLVAGDLLSLGSSFVNMTSTEPGTVDPSGLANAMYDGVGRSFMFTCRTNGALVWDQLRALYGIAKEDYKASEGALSKAAVGKNLVFWQPRTESFPPSGSFDLMRVSGGKDLGNDYAGLIETTLSVMYTYSRHFARVTAEPLYITGGATRSPGIVRRIAAIWNRPVISVENGGAAMGAAVAGVNAYYKSLIEKFNVEDFSFNLVKREVAIKPLTEDVAVFHNKGGFLDKFAAEETKLIDTHPVD
jgi:xylulokinase